MQFYFENTPIDYNQIRNPKNKDFFSSQELLSAANFISNWISGRKTFQTSTSGSTGKPKPITLDRKLMEISALNTINSLGIPSKGNAFLCIPPKFIGGMMLISRALINEMNLYAYRPTGNPLNQEIPDISFHLASMVPMQLYEVLHNKLCKPKLNQFETLLLGGGAISWDVGKSLEKVTTNVYQTYGMTETISHVAVKKLNHGPTSHYVAIGDNNFSTDSSNRLIIQGAVTKQKPLLTNDVVELIDETKFRWVGRYDNIINSGGIKIHPEELESSIVEIFKNAQIQNAFFVAGIEDSKFGSKLILLIEGKTDTEELKNLLKKHLPKYNIPKEIIQLDSFAYTETGKVNRQASIQLTE